MTSKGLLLLLPLLLLPGCPPALWGGGVAKTAAQTILQPKKKNYRTRAITKLEKQYDFDKDGVLNEDEKMRYRQAEAYQKYYKNMWKYDRDGNGRIDAEEYYDAGGEP